jgi:hypothetical protein
MSRRLLVAFGLRWPLLAGVAVAQRQADQPARLGVVAVASACSAAWCM